MSGLRWNGLGLAAQRGIRESREGEREREVTLPAYSAAAGAKGKLGEMHELIKLLN